MTRTLLLSIYLLNGHLNADFMNNWPQWRGPLGTGEAPRSTPPTTWSETENIRWKTPIQGKGHASPIVWNDHIFLTSTDPNGEKLGPPLPQPKGAHNNLDAQRKHQFIVIALSRKTGKILWETTVRNSRPHGSTHESGTWASASPVTDGKHVYAFFGSNGIYCLDFNGRVKWEKDLGDMIVKHGHGEGASPALSKDALIVNWDHEGDSFIVALNKRDGSELWRKGRDEVTSWATPIVINEGKHEQVVVCGTNAIRSYDIRTGETIWSCRGLSNNVVASPVYSNGILFAGSSYDTRKMMAIRIREAKGDLTQTDRILWESQFRPPYVPSPLLVDNPLYYLRHYQNILTRRQADTGKETSGPFRLAGLLNIYASPVAANGNIYITDQQGNTLVIDHKNPRPLRVNQLSEGINASAAMAGKDLLLRGTRHLYCISQREE